MDHISDTARWYALYLRSRHERVVDSRLRESGVETFLPMIEVVKRYSDRHKRGLEPLFRGYVFIRTDLKNRLHILQVHGVVRFVGIENSPSPIPNHQIDWIRRLTECPVPVKRETFIRGGERVQVNAGPFKGIEGIALRMGGHLRIAIAVDCIAQSLSIEIDSALVSVI